LRAWLATDIARLRKHLEHLVAVSESVFSKPIQFDAASDYAFMASVSLERLGYCRGLVLDQNAADVALGHLVDVLEVVLRRFVTVGSSG
jgi:hypothetical protein